MTYEHSQKSPQRLFVILEMQMKATGIRERRIRAREMQMKAIGHSQQRVGTPHLTRTAYETSKDAHEDIETPQ